MDKNADYESHAIQHEQSWFPCKNCGGTRINTLFPLDGIVYFIHTCIHCDAPSEEPTD